MLAPPGQLSFKWRKKVRLMITSIFPIVPVDTCPVNFPSKGVSKRVARHWRGYCTAASLTLRVEEALPRT